MKTKIIFGTIMLAFCNVSFSQLPSLDWSKGIGGSGGIEPYAIAVDGDGSVITVGGLSNLADFDPGAGTFNMTGTPPSNVDMYISKLDENGNFVWAKQLASLWEPKDVKTDAANNIYIVGYYDGDEDFDPGAGIVNLDPSGGGYVLKLNTSGNFVAAHRIAEYADISTLYVSAAGDMYTGGRFYGANDFDPGAGTLNLTAIGNYDYFISHLDPSGNLVWAGQGGSPGSVNTTLRDLTVDDSGNIYCAGSFENTTDMDPGAGIYNMLSAGNGDIFVSKIAPAGNLIWCKQMGGADNHEVGRRIDRDATGNIYVGGTFSSTNVDFDPGAATYILSATHWSGDLFFVKLDHDGNFNWAKQFTSTTLLNLDYLTDMEADDFGNLYATGYMNGIIDFDPGVGSFNLTTTDYASFNLSLNTSGEFDYAFLLDESGFDYGQGLTVENNTLYLTGAFVNTIDFDPGSGTSNMNAGSTHDGYIVKLNNCQNGSFSTVSACSNYTWSATGLTYNSSGTYTANLTNVAGCDSTSILYLTVNTTASGTDVQTACNSFTWINGVTYTSSTSLPTHAISGGAINGCDSIVTLNLTIEDIEDPVANVISLSNITSQCSVTSLTSPTSTDNCAGTISGTHNAILPITAQGTTVVTWTYDDGNGNTTTQNQNVIIDDNTNPVADAVSLTDIMSQCSVISLTAPTATDNCIGTISGTHNATLPITSQGTTVVTWTYDDGNGNSITQNQNVIIDDNTNPVADIVTLSDVTSQCSVTSLTAPTATDNCAGTITGTHNAILPITTQGTTVITWTYDDGNGNTATQNQNVIIDDNTNPVADIVTLPNVTSQCSVSSLTAPTATDNCIGTISGTHNATLPITTQGTTVVTWTYNDGNGNTVTQNQNVIIDDNANPVANIVTLSDVTSQCSVTSLTAPTATDNCAGTITGTHNAILPITTQGTTVVTWTYDDGNGNSITQNQNVIIDDNISPVADVVSLSDITSECFVTSLTAPTATDYCVGIIIGTHNAILPITTQGTTIITWTYDDGNGNSITQNQNVIITQIDNSVSLNTITLTATASGYTYQWIDCGNGNTPIASETNQSFTAIANGTYAVEISNGSCSVTSDCMAVVTFNVNENDSQNGIIVFPNPNNGIFDVLIQLAENKTLEIDLLDMSGKLIESGMFSCDNKIHLAYANLEDGVYLLRTKSDNNYTIHKIIIHQ